MKKEVLLRAHSWRGCSLTYSSFHELSGRAVQPNGTAGIKYVIDGTEHYGLYGKNHFVRSGQYLLVNENRWFDIDLRYTPEAVRGFCITLSNELLDELMYFGNRSEEELLDTPVCNKSAGSDFTEVIQPAGDAVSRLMLQLSAQLNEQTGAVAEQEELLFTRIAEALLVSHGKIALGNKQDMARRSSTRAELSRRIAHARAMMDDAPESVNSIGELARSVALSEFHFMRCFRQMFGISPHQYLMRRRIIKAAALLSDQVPVGEVAARCGFSGPQAFSKAFRKQYGHSPSHFRRIG